MEGPSGVRKGAWTREEDDLLRKCIEKYGEGKWHQIPMRAGLNRCRKCCRLRWLNYLRPNIKRGEFTLDEVDLTMRLHKLLGNRWSLIAGRLPGRTANDVKNYWNTHLHKKLVSHQEVVKDKTQKIMGANIIKPRPRTFSKSLRWLSEKSTIVNNIQSRDNPSPTLPPPQDGIIPWWERLFVDKEVDKGATSFTRWSGEEPIASLLADDIVPATKVGHTFVEEGQSGWNEFSFDMDLWDLLSLEQETVI